jgi:hypothetical protein
LRQKRSFHNHLILRSLQAGRTRDVRINFGATVRGFHPEQPLPYRRTQYRAFETTLPQRLLVSRDIKMSATSFSTHASIPRAMLFGTSAFW